jgi:hypothetical protein
VTLLRPLGAQSFRRLAAGKLLSHLGDWLLVAALIGWIYSTTASTTAVAGLMLLRLGPPILGGGLAAVVVDRLRRDRLLVRIEMARVGAAGLALAGIAAGPRALVFAAVAAGGLLAPVASVAARALVPAVVPREQLPAANAGLGIAHEIAMGAGALVGAGALAGLGAAGAIALVPVASVGAALLYRGIHGAGAPVPRREALGLRAGLRYLRGRRVVLVVVASFGTATLATGLANGTLPRLLADAGLGDGAYGFGLAALAIGLAVGQALAGVVPLDRISVAWIGWALLAMAGLFAVLAGGGGSVTVLVVLGLIGLADGTSEVVFETVVQNEADERFLGCVFGLAQTLMTTTMMGAVAAAPLLNRLASADLVMLVGAGWLLAAGAIPLAASWHPRRQSGEVPPAGFEPALRP